MHSIVAGHEGAGERRRAGGTVGSGLFLALLLSVPLLAFLPYLGRYFDLLGVGPGACRAAGAAYLGWSLVGAFPMAAAGVLGSAFKGMGAMRPALEATTVLSTPVL